MGKRYKKPSERRGIMSGDNGKLKKGQCDITTTEFGGLLEAALRNIINQLEDIDKRLVDIESYIQEDIKNKAAAGRIIRER